MEETKTTNFPITLVAIFLVALGIGYLFANPGVIASSGFFGGHAGSCGGNGGAVSAAAPSQAAATGSGAGIATNTTEEQTITMNVDSNGWSPSSFVIKKGVKVKWMINGNSLNGCNDRVIVSDYGLDIALQSGQNVVEFTPASTGTVRWHCGMNMLQGTFTVVNDPTNQTEVTSATAAAASVPKKSGGCGCGMMGGSGGSCGR